MFEFAKYTITQQRSVIVPATFHALLVFRCPTALSEALGKRATEEHTSISAVIRQILRDGLNK
jgi:hypothetical protein